MTNPAVGAYTARRRRRAWLVVAVVAVVALIAGVVFGPGFDQRDVDPVADDVWVLQSRASMYGAASSSLKEINTVRNVAKPYSVAQHGRDVLVYTDAMASVTAITPGYAADIETGQGTPTPAGTTDISQAGDAVGYLTRTGAVFAGLISDGSAVEPSVFDPYRDEVAADGEEKHVFEAAAVAVRADGKVAAYSASEGLFMTAQIGSTELPEVTKVPAGLVAADVELAFAGDDLVVWDAVSNQLWSTAWPGAVDLAAEKGVLQESMSGADRVYVADEFGLLAVGIESRSVERIAGVDGESMGNPAAPTMVEGAVTAAWLIPVEGPGTLWIDGVEHRLDYAGAVLGDAVATVIKSSGDAAVVSDSVSGWVWTMPDGELVPSSQEWDPEAPTVTTTNEEEVEPEVHEERTPVAVADQFGVRAGAQVRLPVLLNDYDANDDVLAVVPQELEALNESFGKLSIADDGQSIIVDVAADATGSTTFRYAISDGVAKVGASKPATVTLTVHEDSVNSAPVWCGVEACQADWPSPTLVAGGSESIDVLFGWVDPDGDPIYVAEAKSTSGDLTAVAGADGRVAVSHEAESGGDPTVTATVKVSDTRGSTANRQLVLPVSRGSELEIAELTEVVTADARHEIDVTGAITGAAGPVTIADVAADGVTAEVATGVTGIAFQAKEPGTYFVEYSVDDGSATETGQLRVDVIDQEDAEVTTVPLTAFVRAGEDVTVNVLDSVTNPANAVLTVSDVSAEAGEDATVSAEEIALSSIRITAGRDDGSGAAGVVEYTVSDGLHRSATGQISVVLIDSEVAPPPAVADDSYTVRAGTQMDFQVLDNDTPAPGTVVALTAGSVAADEGEGLAFTSGRVIRYLAPTVKGTYLFHYDAYAVGYPSQHSRGTVRVTVVGEGRNTPPTPSRVEARVNSGMTVTIPIPTTGQDADGDRTELVGLGDVPAAGTAVMTADGTGIEYTAPEDFPGGQVPFTVVVQDPGKASAEAEVVVAVNADEAGVAPVAYTDTVQVQLGADSQVRVEPVANDVDALGSGLVLDKVEPNATPGDSEYAAMQDLILDVDPETGLVTFGAGDTPTTYSFLYTVVDERGSASAGRIVLKVVREDIPDLPIIADTILDFGNRERFETGVNVLDGTASWATGDIAQLSVATWAGQPEVVASGTTVSGPLPTTTSLKVYEVRGEDFSGSQVLTYGFLTVPGEADYVPKLNSDAEPIAVDENATQTADLAAMISVPEGKSLEIDAGSVAAAGARAEATCVAEGGTTIRYDAGTGSPYTDTCLVNVKASGQSAWTLISVPVIVTPDVPVPTLTSLALTVSPGETRSINLAEAVTWPTPGKERPVELVAGAPSGTSFVVSQSGGSLSVAAQDEAAPGTVERVTLTAPAEEGVQPASIELTVGPAPQTLPKGGSVVQGCKQGSGSSCEIKLVGAAGEVNPFDSPLEVVSVSDAGDCPGLKITKASATTAKASWTDSAAGGVCDAVFTVKDAQGRVTSGDRVGTISIDFLGYPAKAASVVQSDYGDGSVTLDVSPGGAASSYPAISGFVVKDGSSTVATCSASGSCPKITGVANGDKRTYTVYAVNSVGQSKQAVETTAWAYAPPDRIGKEQITATAVPNGNSGKLVDLTINVGDADTASVIVAVNGNTKTLPVSGGSASISGLNVGDNFGATLTVTPVSAYEAPIGDAGDEGASTSVTVNGVGAPELSVSVVNNGASNGPASLSIDLGSGGSGSTIWYGVSTHGNCNPNSQVGAGTITENVSVDLNEVNEVTVCAESRVGGQTFGSASVTKSIVPINIPVPNISDYSWGVNCTGGTCRTVNGGGGSGRPGQISGVQPSFDGIYVSSDGTESTSFPWGTVDNHGSVRAKACKNIGGERRCSDLSNAASPAFLNNGSGQAFNLSPTCSLQQQSPANGANPATYKLVLHGVAAPTGVSVSATSFPASWGSDPINVAFDDPGAETSATLQISFGGSFSGIPNHSFDYNCQKQN